MWPEFVPVEFRGISIITALILFFVIMWIRDLTMKVKCLDKCLNEIKVSLGQISVYSKEQREDIREIKERLI